MASSRQAARTLGLQPSHRALRPGGSVWVFDLVESSIPAVQELMWQQYGEYLIHLKDEAYRDHVFAYVEKEDTPRPLLFQLDLLRQVGLSQGNARIIQPATRNSMYCAVCQQGRWWTASWLRSTRTVGPICGGCYVGMGWPTRGGFGRRGNGARCAMYCSICCIIAGVA